MALDLRVKMWMNMNVQAMSFTLNLSQPTGTPPSEHGTASEGGRRQPAGQADALQVSYWEGGIQMDFYWIATISQALTGVQNMCQRVSTAARHFNTIYAIFTRFYVIFAQFYTIFTQLTQFLRFLRDFLPGTNFLLPGT